MRKYRVGAFVLVSLGVGAACGGSTIKSNGTDGGTAGSSDSSSETSSNGSGSDAGPTVGMIPCGALTCSAPQVCCFAMATGGDGGGDAGSSCADPGACPTGTVAISCTSSQNCVGGMVCCFSFGRGGSDGPTCQGSCAEGVVLCATDSECPVATQCVSFRGGAKKVSPGVGICQNSDAGDFGRDAGGGG